MKAAMVWVPAELFAELGDAIARVTAALDELIEYGGVVVDASDREARNELEATWALTRLSGVQWHAVLEDIA